MIMWCSYRCWRVQRSIHWGSGGTWRGCSGSIWGSGGSQHSSGGSWWYLRGAWRAWLGSTALRWELYGPETVWLGSLRFFWVLLRWNFPVEEQRTESVCLIRTNETSAGNKKKQNKMCVWVTAQCVCVFEWQLSVCVCVWVWVCVCAMMFALITLISVFNSLYLFIILLPMNYEAGCLCVCVLIMNECVHQTGFGTRSAASRLSVVTHKQQHRFMFCFIRQQETGSARASSDQMFSSQTPRWRRSVKLYWSLLQWQNGHWIAVLMVDLIQHTSDIRT